MKRRQSIALALILALAAVVAIWYGWSKHLKRNQEAAHQREVEYEEALRSYTTVLTPGMTRQQVEEYLQKMGIQFSRTPWVTNTDNSDITKIGQEPAPYYCSRKNIYIAFQFAPEASSSAPPDPSDPLTNITIFPMLEDCL
jgi:type II secretory pathway pseudopilin PulG